MLRAARGRPDWPGGSPLLARGQCCSIATLPANVTAIVSFIVGHMRLSDSAPSTVKAGVTKDESASMKAKLEEQGAVVEVK